MFETDDDDFMLSPSSKLSAIFNISSISDDSSASASLTYKAPKQPKPSNINTKVTEPEAMAESRAQTQSSVILAKVITLWKHDKGNNKPMGQYMVAIIGNPSKDLFEIIIYQDKTNIIIRETLGKTLTLYKYPNNFVAFYDNQKQLWNLNFDSFDSKESFLENANKYNCIIIAPNEPSNNTDEGDSSVNNKLLSGKSDTTTKEPDEPNKDSNSKENILSRITKMGQQILPRAIDRSRSSEPSDSETESSYSDSRPTKPITAPRKFKRNLNHEKALAPIRTESHISNFSPQIASNNNFLVPNNQMMLNTQHTGVMYSQPLPDYGLSNFIIAQNAELKANLAEINIKLNNVLSKSDKNGNTSEDLSTLNSKIKCQNLKIDNLCTDLERSQKALNDLKKKYNAKCEELIAEQHKTELSANYEVEVNILRKTVQNIDALQNEKAQLQTELKEKDKQIEIQRLKLKDFEDYYKTNEPLKENLLKENNNLKLNLEVTTLKVNEYEEELKQKENQVSLINQKSLVLDKKMVAEVVKESMNEAYRSIMERFDENETYEFNDIQGVLLENLKKTSYRLINSLL